MFKVGKSRQNDVVGGCRRHHNSVERWLSSQVELLYFLFRSSDFVRCYSSTLTARLQATGINTMEQLRRHRRRLTARFQPLRTIARVCTCPWEREADWWRSTVCVQASVFGNYKLVSRNDLEKLGIANQEGTLLLRGDMHGFFITRISTIASRPSPIRSSTKSQGTFGCQVVKSSCTPSCCQQQRQ